MPSFNATSEIALSRKKKFCKQGGKLDYSRYSRVSLLTLCYHWSTLSISFLLPARESKQGNVIGLVSV